jgi:tetratricopeptide (TPR) repeat protein
MNYARLTCWVISGLMSVASGAFAQNSITAPDVDGIDYATAIIRAELAQPPAKNVMRLAEAQQGLQTHALPEIAGREARRRAQILAQAPNPATASPQSGPVPTDEMLEILLREADALLKGGKPAEAYSLLEPKEADYAGEISFDYLLGIAALDSGKPDRATIAFERILTVNPNFAGARLDMARAYFAMGSDDLAKVEFEKVLAQSPPEATAAVIKKHLEVIADRQKARIQQVNIYLETNFGHDSNITAATPDNVGGVAGILGRTPAELIALQYRPTGSSLHYSGNYAGVSGGVDFNRVVNEEKGISIQAGGDLKQRVYNNVEEMNNLSLDLRAGVALARGDNRYRLGGTYGQFRQSGFAQIQPSPPLNSFRDTAGLNAEWKHSFGTRDQMGWSFGVSRPRYLTELTRTQDTNQRSLNASWLHVFEGKTNPLIFANFNRSVDKALRPVNVATGANMGRTNTGVLLYFQFTPFTNTDFFLTGGLTRRRDDSAGARSPGLADFFARDDTQALSLGFTTRPWNKWSIKGTVALTKNRSNLSLYEYSRNDTSLSLRRDF